MTVLNYSQLTIIICDSDLSVSDIHEEPVCLRHGDSVLLSCHPDDLSGEGFWELEKVVVNDEDIHTRQSGSHA